MTQLSISFDQAKTRRDRGMSRAAEHADRVTPEWTGIAFDCLKALVQLRDAPFLAEDAIQALGGSVPPPPDGRAWGAVFQRAARAGLIRKVGYAPARSSNLSPKVLWSRA